MTSWCMKCNTLENASMEIINFLSMIVPVNDGWNYSNVDNRQFIDNFNYGAQKLNWKKKKKNEKNKTNWSCWLNLIKFV